MMLDEIIECVVAIMVIAMLVCLLVVAPIVGAVYYSSCKQADLFNRQHGTAWTCSDFFWASDQINRSTSTVVVK